MKRSQAVTLTLLAAAAAALTGCSRKTEVMRCVDDKQRIVDDAFCAQQPGKTGNTTRPGGGGYIGYYPYHWWYGGSAGNHVGDAVVGGAATPTPGTRGVSASGVSRGGFGHSMGIGS